MLLTSNVLKITSFKIIQAKRSFVINVETGSQKLVILSYATVCLHPSVSLNNEKNCLSISIGNYTVREVLMKNRTRVWRNVYNKIAVCEKTAGLRSGNSSDLDSACLKVLVPVKIFQI